MFFAECWAEHLNLYAEFTRARDSRPNQRPSIFAWSKSAVAVSKPIFRAKKKPPKEGGLFLAHNDRGSYNLNKGCFSAYCLRIVGSTTVCVVLKNNNICSVKDKCQCVHK